MKNILLLFILLFFFSFSSNAQHLSFDVKTGVHKATLKVLDQYTIEDEPLFRNREIPSVLFSGSMKYFVNRSFYTGLEMEYYSLKSERNRLLSYDDYNEVNSNFIDIFGWDIKRKRVVNSFLVGYEFAKIPFYIELGGSYHVNISQSMDGRKINRQHGSEISITVLEEVDYGRSASFGYFLGMGIRVHVTDAAFFLVETKLRHEQPSTPGIKTKFKVAHKYTPSFNLGVGYSINRKSLKTPS